MYRYSDCYDEKVADSDDVRDNSKSLPIELRQRWVRELCEWADAKWGPGWTQQQMADALEIKQGQWSDMRNKYAGIGVLQIMRASKVTNRTINDMLGLPYPNTNERDLTILVTKMEELLADLSATFVHGGRRAELIREIRRIAQNTPYWRMPPNPVTKIEASAVHEPRSARSRFPKPRKKAASG